MSLKLPFYGRFDEDDWIQKSAWTEYEQSLREVGIHPDQPVYRYFVGEAFHDSPIQVSFLLDYEASNVVFNMRNIRLLDEINLRYKVDIKRPDFHADVTFVNCHRVEFKCDLTKQHWCHYSAITKVCGLIEVLIATSHRIDDGTLDDYIRIVAEEVVVEDITQRLSERYGIPRAEIEELMVDWHRGHLTE